MLYSKRIAGRDVASWLGTAGQVNIFNISLPDCYIRVYRSFWQGTANFATLGYTPKITIAGARYFF